MDILRKNAFRILGLPVTASRKEIVGRVDEIQAHITIGQTIHYDTDFPWIGELQRNGETAKEASQVLENPSAKLEHLLSWFWVIDEFDNLAIDALKNEDVDKAVEIWSAAAQQKGSHHKKNLATLQQILAFQESDSDYQHLKGTIRFWAELTSSNQLFHLIENITPKLSKLVTNGQITRFVGSHISQTAKLFLFRWIDENRLDRIGQFFDDLSESDLSPKIVTSIKEDYVKPLSEEIDKMCGKFSDMKGDYEKIYTKTKKFFKKVNPYLEKIKQTGDSFLIENYGDKIGEVILDNAIKYWNNTYNWEKCEELCEMAETVITGLLLKERLEKTINTISDYAEPEEMWENAEQEEILENLEPINRSTSHFQTIKVVGGILLGLVALAVMIWLFSPDRDFYSGTNLNQDYSSSSLSYSSSHEASSSSQEIAMLRQKIDDTKLKLNKMESGFPLLESTLERHENQLKRLKEDINDAERKLERGLYVNKATYHSNIDSYNNLLQKHESILTDYQTKYDEYKRLLDATNADIARYNRLTGAK
ncbi:hypothetical protein KAW65_07465 [candidate division WOR-3 bacterium]|nr:hypothetical protein [candidate division WOR-3 bacterium]